MAEETPGPHYNPTGSYTCAVCEKPYGLYGHPSCLNNRPEPSGNLESEPCGPECLTGLGHDPGCVLHRPEPSSTLEAQHE